MTGVVAAAGEDEGPRTVTTARASGDKGVRVVDASFSGIATTTASDWIAHGQHAAVVEVVPGSVRRGAVPKDEKDNGEGHIPRTATMRVLEVLWSKPGAQTPPKTYVNDLLGWWWEGDGEQEFAYSGEPRFEESHKYIVLLMQRDTGEWADARNAMPYDDGQVGTGEMAGTIRSSRSPGEELEGLAKEANGKDAATVKRLLNAAKPQQ